MLACTLKALPPAQLVAAAQTAVEQNPANAPPTLQWAMALGVAPTRERLAVLTTKYWGPKGVRLTVGFLDQPTASLRRKIMAHLNAWGKQARVKFVSSRREPQVRIARLDGADGGYWSYLGTDVLLIPAGEPTMNVEGFTDATPESEFRRVVRHEAGHTLGFPHEHMRRALVDLLDAAKVQEYFQRTQGWTEEDVRQQVLTPLEEAELLATCQADATSIMTYQIPGQLTKSGEPILGGLDINANDRAFVAKIYPPRTRSLS